MLILCSVCLQGFCWVLLRCTAVLQRSRCCSRCSLGLVVAAGCFACPEVRPAAARRVLLAEEEPLCGAGVPGCGEFSSTPVVGQFCWLPLELRHSRIVNASAVGSDVVWTLCRLCSRQRAQYHRYSGTALPGRLTWPVRSHEWPPLWCDVRSSGSAAALLCDVKEVLTTDTAGGSCTG